MAHSTNRLGRAAARSRALLGPLFLFVAACIILRMVGFVIADDVFQRADLECWTLLATGHDGDRT